MANATFTTEQKRVLAFQLLAISIWTIAAIGLVLYSIWTGLNLSVLFSLSSKRIIAALNWCLLGFVAVTSIVPGVSILTSLRSWTGSEPAKGQNSKLIGAVLLIGLAYWTWTTFMAGL
jgi:hypothetical protein